MAVSRFEPTATMTQPAPRNSSALNAPWASRWKIAPSRVPTARPPAMYASWLIVE